MQKSCAARRMFAGIPTASISLRQYPPPRLGEVHFWCLFPKEVQNTTLMDAYKGLLSSEEHTQILQMEEKQIQKQAVLARVLVRTTLARYMDGQINPKSLKFSKNKFGKPEVIWPCDTSYENKWKPPTLCFNLAHTSSLICCGVTTKSSVGIDVEEKGRRMRTNILAFAKRYFSPPEIAWLETCKDPEEQCQKFIQLWTLKEAYVKALGRGISGAPLKDFAIHIEHLPVVQGCIGQYENAGSDSFPTNLHYASVCLEQDEKRLPEDDISRMNFPGIKMHIWKTVPLVKDESMSVKEAVIASTNSVSF